MSSIYVINSTEAPKVHLIGEKGMRMTRSRVIYNKVRAYIIICATPFLLISRQNTSRDSCVFSVKDYLCGDTISNHLKRYLAMGRFINPFTDFGFHRIFGQEIHKELLIDFLNQLIS